MTEGVLTKNDMMGNAKEVCLITHHHTFLDLPHSATFKTLPMQLN
jgi:hypothetical protein